jgi:hypothetical protein
MKHPVGTTANNIPVYVDLTRSQAAVHIARHPHLLGLVKEVVERLTATGPMVSAEYDMGREIGYNFVVETTDKDTILYACLLHDDIYTRFVKNGKPTRTSYLTIVLQREGDDGYLLRDTWIGRTNPPRPGSPNETAKSKPYWANHAYVFDNQPIQSRTITRECPY